MHHGVNLPVLCYISFNVNHYVSFNVNLSMECYLALKKWFISKNYILKSGIVAQDYIPNTHVSEAGEF